MENVIFDFRILMKRLGAANFLEIPVRDRDFISKVTSLTLEFY